MEEAFAEMQVMELLLGLEPAARDSLLEAVRQLEAESSAEREVSACLQNQQTVPETASSEASCV